MRAFEFEAFGAFGVEGLGDGWGYNIIEHPTFNPEPDASVPVVPSVPSVPSHSSVPEHIRHDFGEWLWLGSGLLRFDSLCVVFAHNVVSVLHPKP